MTDLTWTFAPSSGGQEVGIHDPGVETFRGNFSHYLARELIQNSLDARLDTNKPVRVTFSLEEIDARDIPDLGGLRLAFARCIEYWNHQPKTVSILDRGLESLSGRKVRVLKTSDYNTRGIGGSDTNRSGDWYNLVRCAGSSAKSEGAGGSYGIGKNAPFAASLARTVFYATKTMSGAVAFQGVARLATHQDATGVTLQSTGFLGARGNAAVRSVALFPSAFVRADTGSDIWIVGYPADPSWKEDLIFSVLDDFWPAIRFGDLIVEVGENRISQANLEAQLLARSTEPDFTGHLYYETFSEPEVSTPVNIPDLGACSIYLSTRVNDRPMKRVAMVRKTGMIITRRQFRSPVPFAGVFICKDDVGNARLREMEPPRHDDWSQDYPEKGASKKIRDAIGEAIREEIKKLLPAADGQTLSIPGLERFLPDLNPDAGDATWSDGTTSTEGTDETIREPLELRPISPRKKQVAISDEGPGPSGGSDSEEPGPELGSETSEHERDAAPDRSGEPTSGTHDDGGRAREPIPIQYRSFSVDSGAGKYIAIIHSPKDSANAVVSAYGVGEDQKSAMPFLAARASNGVDLPISHGQIGPIKLKAGEPLAIEFSTVAGRYALEITANEG